MSPPRLGISGRAVGLGDHLEPDGGHLDEQHAPAPVRVERGPRLLPVACLRLRVVDQARPADQRHVRRQPPRPDSGAPPGDGRATAPPCGCRGWWPAKPPSLRRAGAGPWRAPPDGLPHPDWPARRTPLHPPPRARSRAVRRATASGRQLASGRQPRSRRRSRPSTRETRSLYIFYAFSEFQTSLRSRPRSAAFVRARGTDVSLASRRPRAGART